jgi:hypothetical protein
LGVVVGGLDIEAAGMTANARGASDAWIVRPTAMAATMRQRNDLLHRTSTADPIIRSNPQGLPIVGDPTKRIT